tara:strand:- start:596 stop:2356 length:1761 start_codon:yes stop_codon:yes gene_type:complete
MDEWADVEGAIKAAIKQRQKRLESLTGISAMLILSSTIWLIWPNLTSAIKGESGLFSVLGLPLLVLVWGLMVQDLGLSDPRSRTRVGATASIAWPVLLIIAAQRFTLDNNSEAVGAVMIGLVSFSCLFSSKIILKGGLDVLRFRSVMTGIGSLAAFSLFVGDVPEPSSINWYANVSVIVGGIAYTCYIWVAGDDQRELRKKFQKRLDRLEVHILELKAQGSAVDQASSLVMTAREEGHVDPELGMRLLNNAEEDIERSLSLADDVEAVLQDAKKFMEQAEDIAPTVKRPRKAFDMGLREIELGSLREGEMLFRQAKKRAKEVIEWWSQAEKAIGEAQRQLDGKTEQNFLHLHEMLADAKKKLYAESPKKAFEFAIVIPAQLAAGDDALTHAAEAIKEAERQLKQVDGLDTSDMESRMDVANQALEAGNASQATGLADGVVRTIQAERSAMDDVRRAFKQKKKLIKRFEHREDKEIWANRITEIEESADKKEWTHAATLLDRLTSDLDKEGKASEDAKELLDFVTEEWKVLRNQCEAALIKVDDEERRECEKAISLSKDALDIGGIEQCLQQLSNADSLMEKLRRRI